MATSKEIVNIEELNSTTVLSILTTGSKAKYVFKPANPEDTAKRIAQRDLNASSLDDLLGGESTTISGRDYINKPFTLTSVEWQSSEIEGQGLPFYAVCHIVTLDGESKVLTTGASTVVRKLAKIDSENWLPAKVKITKGPKTEAGYEPLDLVKADF